MLSTNVRVVVRTRPFASSSSELFSVDEEKEAVEVKVPLKHESYQFRFNKVLHNASQETVFNECLPKILQGAVEGYNGTVMAYGQTGAGKTYTMCGSLRSFDLRGIIPRSISSLFSLLEEQTGIEFSLCVSYCEIYSELIFDLLAEGGLEGQTGTELQANPGGLPGWIVGSWAVSASLWVVVALGEKGREHIPYRSTRLTHLLKDTIGGNSNTCLIANIWPEKEHLEETLSTLRFSLRMMRSFEAPSPEEIEEMRKEATLFLNGEQEAIPFSSLRKMEELLHVIRSIFQETTAAIRREASYSGSVAASVPHSENSVGHQGALELAGNSKAVGATAPAKSVKEQSKASQQGSPQGAPSLAPKPVQKVGYEDPSVGGHSLGIDPDHPPRGNASAASLEPPTAIDRVRAFKEFKETQGQQLHLSLVSLKAQQQQEKTQLKVLSQEILAFRDKLKSLREEVGGKEEHGKPTQPVKFQILSVHPDMDRYDFDESNTGRGKASEK
ncbi:kinesin motor domain-containing protein [Cyclospora cayetanensis]|uniref:Kinesin motor domain-containing protein n=1 Tax=Cyclospora cayetanensis TaxID=88456 RepID=A0A1D3CW32_9EIME|nr:kinesin motor domain-containing protein [Cyclospora cayetanensis]